MKRRNFLMGVGGTAIGGSALLGTGAFSRVESQRRAKIQVAKDTDAYLGLDGCADSPNRSYTNIDSNGHLEIDMSPDNPTDAGGQGVNSDSRTWFHDVYQICNNGKQEVCIWIADDDNWPRVPENYDDAGDRRVGFYLGDDPGQSLVGKDNQILLDVGECVCVGLRTNTKGLGKGDQLLEDLGDEIVIVADEDCKPETPPIELSNTAISFVAFCREDGADVTVTDIETIATNDEGEPVGIRWTTDDPVGEVILKGGTEWYRYAYDPPTTTGVAWMSDSPPNAALEQGTTVSFPDDDFTRCPSSPCDGVAGTKIEYDDDLEDFNLANPERTREFCP